MFNKKEETNSGCITDIKQKVAVLEVEVKHLGDSQDGMKTEIHELKRSVVDGNKTLMDRLDRNHEKVMERMDGNFIKIDKRLDETNIRIDEHERIDAKDHGVVKGMVWILGGLMTVGSAIAAIGIHFNWF